LGCAAIKINPKFQGADSPSNNALKLHKISFYFACGIFSNKANRAEEIPLSFKQRRNNPARKIEFRAYP